MTIHLPKELETQIQAAVEAGQFRSLDAAMAEAAALLVERIGQENKKQSAASPPGSPHRPIWEEFGEIAASVPGEEWAKLPVDGAEQHDHYIHGTPKRPAP